jgi:hypothetical protein
VLTSIRFTAETQSTAAEGAQRKTEIRTLLNGQQTTDYGQVLAILAFSFGARIDDREQHALY